MWGGALEDEGPSSAVQHVALRPGDHSPGGLRGRAARRARFSLPLAPPIGCLHLGAREKKFGVVGLLGDIRLPETPVGCMRADVAGGVALPLPRALQGLAPERHLRCPMGTTLVSSSPTGTARAARAHRKHAPDTDGRWESGPAAWCAPARASGTCLYVGSYW